jgi:hypothetical protein
MMKAAIKRSRWSKNLVRNRGHCRLRRHLPSVAPAVHDDLDGVSDEVCAVEPSWPERRRQPKVGVNRDPSESPGAPPAWTKYVRFLKNNGIPFAFTGSTRSIGWSRRSTTTPSLGSNFEKRRYRIQELVLREFLATQFLVEGCSGKEGP